MENDMTKELSDEQLLRYSRQIMIPGFDIAGQQALCSASVLIVGMGGLGAPVSMYLAAAGVGSIVMADDDTVELTNLQRQIVHRSDALGQKKVDSAAATLKQINPQTQVTPLDCRLHGEALMRQVEMADLVLDCSDNFGTRFEVNKACVASGTPLVSGAAIRMEGQVAVFDSRDADSPCYACLYPDLEDEQLTCSESGVMAPLVGIIGSVQAMEAIKLLSGYGEPLKGKLLLLDALNMQWRSLKLSASKSCPVCGIE